MLRDTRYDILFEPVRIGPVTAKNRFYQVPHCTGMGRLRPHMLAGLRGMKAEGGWAVVCTEYCSIHAASDDLPHPYASLWNESDIKANALMVENVHAHGALAGVELWFGGSNTSNLFTREVSMDVDSLPSQAGNPFQSRAMDKEDIRNLRRWHRDAALRAKSAEFDIVYGEGISREGEIIELGVKNNIIDKSGAWYSYKDDRIGQGKENVRNFLKENSFSMYILSILPT